MRFCCAACLWRTMVGTKPIVLPCRRCPLLQARMSSLLRNTSGGAMAAEGMVWRRSEEMCCRTDWVSILGSTKPGWQVVPATSPVHTYTTAESYGVKPC